MERSIVLQDLANCRTELTALVQSKLPNDWSDIEAWALRWRTWFKFNLPDCAGEFDVLAREPSWSHKEFSVHRVFEDPARLSNPNFANDRLLVDTMAEQSNNRELRSRALRNLDAYLEGIERTISSATSRRQSSGESPRFAEKPSHEQQIPQVVERLGASMQPQQPRSILFLAADPKNANRTRLGEEVHKIQQELRLGNHGDSFVLVSEWAVQFQAFAREILRVRPRIVHFSGHGTNQGELCLEDEAGMIKPVPAQALTSLFRQFESDVECVVLNACWSLRQARAIAKHIPFVIGMNTKISDAAAIAFSVGFYLGLAGGLSVPQAFDLALSQVQAHSLSEGATPKLLRRSEKSRPSGRL